MRPLHAALALLVPLLAARSPAQSTWHVDASAPGPGDGSPGDPYLSIQQAIAAPTTVSGDTVLVAPGEYAEEIDFLTKSLTVRAVGGPLATRIVPPSPATSTLVTMGEPAMAHPPAVLEGFHVRRDAPLPPALPTGEGVRILDSAQGRLVRCILDGHGSGVVNNYDAILEECTVTRNRWGIQGSSLGIHFLDDVICQGNLQGDFGRMAFGPCVSTTWSDLGNLANLFNCGLDQGNFDADPRFWDAANGDYRLRPDSPCIDTGNPSDPLDPDGSRRDVGALAHDPYHAPGSSRACFGDALACPCGNGGSGEGGCNNAQSTGGVALRVRDFTPDGAGGGTARFEGSGYPPAAHPAVLLLRSTALEPQAVPFGDGIRCLAAAALQRLNTVIAGGGISLSSVLHGAGAGTYHYQAAYRNLPAAFCDPVATFNATNVVTLTW